VRIIGEGKKPPGTESTAVSDPTISVSDDRGQHLGEFTLSGWVSGSGVLRLDDDHRWSPLVKAYLMVGCPSALLSLFLITTSFHRPRYQGTLLFLGLMALIVQYFPVTISYANLSLGVGFLLAASLLGGPAAGALLGATVFLIWTPTRELTPWSATFRRMKWPETLGRTLFASATASLSYFLATKTAFSIFGLKEPVEDVDLGTFGASIVLAVGVYILQNLFSLLLLFFSGEDLSLRLKAAIPLPALVEFVALPASLLLAVIRLRMGLGAFLLLSWLYLIASILGWRSWQDRKRTERKIRDLRLLHTAGSTLSGTLELGDVVRRLHGILRQIKEFDRLLLVIRDIENRDVQVFVTDAGGHRGEADPELIEDTESLPEGLFFETDGSSVFTRDLRIGETAAARIRLDFPPSDSPTHPSIVLLETVCRQAAAALSNARLYFLANTDPLTGLAIRRYFERAIRSAWASGESFAAILLDLDWFKGINDTHGHKAGDLVLEDLAEVLRGSLRVMDVAARYGGEEFIILLPGSTSPEAAAVAERIRRTLQQRAVLSDAGRKIHYTASFGVACARDVETGVDPMEVVWKADAALLEAKRAGRNQVVTWAGIKG